VYLFQSGRRMASGKAHRCTTIFIAAPLGLSVTLWTTDIFAGLCCFSGCILGLWIHPDLDIDKYARWPWRTYARVMWHRHIWSHSPVLGTALRLAYLLTIPALVFNLLVPGVIGSPLGLWLIRWYGAWIFLGLASSDTLHWCMDGFPVRVSYGRARHK